MPKTTCEIEGGWNEPSKEENTGLNNMSRLKKAKDQKTPLKFPTKQSGTNNTNCIGKIIYRYERRELMNLILAYTMYFRKQQTIHGEMPYNN